MGSINLLPIFFVLYLIFISMENKPVIEKFDAWLNRIWKYILIIVAAGGVVWTVAMAWGQMIEVMEEQQKIRVDIDYGFDRVERISKRRMDESVTLFERLQEIDGKQWRKINESETLLEKHKIDDAYNRGKWDGRWEFIKEKIK